jgi:hypothetical protein
MMSRAVRAKEVCRVLFGLASVLDPILFLLTAPAYPKAAAQEIQPPVDRGSQGAASATSLPRSDERPQLANGKSAASALVDVTPRPLAFVKPGTAIGDGSAEGWSDLILLARPRMGVGDVDAVSRPLRRLGTLFSFVIVANVRPDTAKNGERQGHHLERVAIGCATDVNGRDLIVSSEHLFGADLGIVGRAALREHEGHLKTEVVQVARTQTMSVFDADAVILRGDKHTRMVIRHVIAVMPETGRLSTFAWLLTRESADRYSLAEDVVQVLPPHLHEDRVISVDARTFTLGMPSADSFAYVKPMQGMPVHFSQTLAALAPVRRFTPALAIQLEAELRTKYGSLVDRAKPSASQRR